MHMDCRFFTVSGMMMLLESECFYTNDIKAVLFSSVDIIKRNVT